MNSHMSFPLSPLPFLLPLPFTDALDSDITLAVVDFPATVCGIVSARDASLPHHRHDVSVVAEEFLRILSHLYKIPYIEVGDDYVAYNNENEGLIECLKKDVGVVDFR